MVRSRDYRSFLEDACIRPGFKVKFRKYSRNHQTKLDL